MTFVVAVGSNSFAETTVFRNLHAIPMDGDRVLDSAAVVVRDSRIVEVITDDDGFVAPYDRWRAWT